MIFGTGFVLFMFASFLLVAQDRWPRWVGLTLRTVLSAGVLLMLVSMGMILAGMLP